MGIDMRVFDLCQSCMHLSEIQKMDPPVEIPVRHTHLCRIIEITTCVRLGRLWPTCRNGEDVFAQSTTCHGFSPGTPRQLSFFVVVPKA